MMVESSDFDNPHILITLRMLVKLAHILAQRLGLRIRKDFDWITDILGNLDVIIVSL